MAAFDQEAYQPIAGDLSIQEVRAGRFTIHRYDGQSWQQLGAGHNEQDIKALVAPMEFLGESKDKRQYYRPSLVDVIERIQEPNGHVFYRIFSEYARASLAMDPTDLLNLLVYLSDNEELIRIDSRMNLLVEKNKQE